MAPRERGTPALYESTLLIENSPHLGPYSIPRALRWSFWGGGAFLMSEVPLKRAGAANTYLSTPEDAHVLLSTKSLPGDALALCHAGPLTLHLCRCRALATQLAQFLETSVGKGIAVRGLSAQPEESTDGRGARAADED